MTNPKKPGRYRVIFRGKDGAAEGQVWEYYGLLTFTGQKWLLNGRDCDMTGAQKWEEIKEL